MKDKNRLWKLIIVQYLRFRHKCHLKYECDCLLGKTFRINGYSLLEYLSPVMPDHSL